MNLNIQNGFNEYNSVVISVMMDLENRDENTIQPPNWVPAKWDNKKEPPSKPVAYIELRSSIFFIPHEENCKYKIVLMNVSKDSITTYIKDD